MNQQETSNTSGWRHVSGRYVQGRTDEGTKRPFAVFDAVHVTLGL